MDCLMIRSPQGPFPPWRGASPKRKKRSQDSPDWRAVSAFARPESQPSDRTHHELTQA